MALQSTIDRMKTALRISHDALDDEIHDQVDTCIADLNLCGIRNVDENDALILNAIKLWVRAGMDCDVIRSEAFMQSYNDMKACLMSATGYGLEDDVVE